MPKIIELDRNLINKIAAGEVIERPASVVKELVENSIDAGATSITVEVIEGGKTQIRIEDNGSGIEAEELSLAVKRHTTSKIRSAEDLFNISTLGFRGEALASIGSVSYLRMTSKTKESDSAQCIEVEDGILISDKPAASVDGTIVEVNNLFFNVPARKKHLKSMQAEFRHIVDLITRYILIHPGIHFKLVHNGIVEINSPSSNDPIASIASVYGRSITKNLIPVSFSFFDIDIKGFVSKPGTTRADRSYQSIFMNKRHIRNNTIQRAVYDGYGSLLFHGRHPVFILEISIDPSKIDVNVHPQKQEIRLEKEQEMYSAVKNGVISSLMSEKLIPMIDEIKTKNLDTKLVITQNNELYTQSRLGSEILRTTKDWRDSEQKKPELKIRLIGKLHNMFIIAEDQDGLLLIDQHAAHERVMYETYLKQYKNDALKVQELISPIVFEANPTENLVIAQNLETLKGMGIFIEPFGTSTFIIRALPSVLSRQQTSAILNDIIDELNNDELDALSTIREERIAMAACKSAVKAHDALEMPEVYKILEDLFKCENPNTCPHGRPVMICFPRYELEKKFKRIV